MRPPRWLCIAAVNGSCLRVSRFDTGRIFSLSCVALMCSYQAKGHRNIVTGSPISDINPLYMAAGATFAIAADGSPTHEVTCRAC